MLLGDVSILVIEDVNAMRAQIKMLLKNFGFRKVAVCEDAAQASAILDTESFQLVLCDWHLGTVSGLEFLQYVRTHATHKDLGFIMVTAECTRDRVLDAIKSGVDDYLVKPLTPGQIQDKVYGVLLKRQVL
ncbi:MAG: hypothetical protein A2428_00060 [Bdellovibrionales bacterium RIFOXYC1_FULL_54_43]|nr:MAG: hypothetical protein A2428_00060 [Bdellovibrionales bacterium RIFOXYC1_FULL_54_43]OFZ81821.1 MAG: hypothetical protein A2603_06560 [Bdellovibrionales bacterium RIFOXYD1_FULL_55_31]